MTPLEIAVRALVETWRNRVARRRLIHSRIVDPPNARTIHHAGTEMLEDCVEQLDAALLPGLAARPTPGAASPAPQEDTRPFRVPLANLRQLGTDLNRGAQIANLAEHIWDACDAIDRALAQAPRYSLFFNRPDPRGDVIKLADLEAPRPASTAPVEEKS